MYKKPIIYLLLFLMVISFSLAYRRVGTTYHPKEYVVSEMKKICGENTFKCKYEVIGKTYLGKDIYLFKIGNPNGGSILMDGSMHGWEDSGTEIMLNFTQWLFNSDDEKAKEILSKNYLLMIPIVNVDTTDRQTMRRVNPDGTPICCGVDINRNFCAGFGKSGSSDTTQGWPVTYRGQYCESESETKAVSNTMKKYKPDVYINWHMGGGKTWGSCGNTTLYNKIIEKYDGYRTEYSVSYRYPISNSISCKSGMAQSQAFAEGSELSFITETTESDVLPNTAQDFYNDFYMKNFVMLLAITDGVESETQPHIEIPFDFSNLTSKEIAIGVIVISILCLFILLYFASKTKKF